MLDAISCATSTVLRQGFAKFYYSGVSASKPKKVLKNSDNDDYMIGWKEDQNICTFNNLTNSSMILYMKVGEKIVGSFRRVKFSHSRMAKRTVMKILPTLKSEVYSEIVFVEFLDIKIDPETLNFSVYSCVISISTCHRNDFMLLNCRFRCCLLWVRFRTLTLKKV